MVKFEEVGVVLDSYREVFEKKAPEANIQAMMMFALYDAGYWPILEERVKCKYGKMFFVQADVAVYDKEWNLICLLEMKSRYDNEDLPIAFPQNQGSRQFQKYQSTGVPFRYCYNLKQIPATIEWVNSLRGL